MQWCLDSLQPYGLYIPWNFPGQSTGVGSLSLLQGIFLTQGLSPGLPHCRPILHQLSHWGSQRVLECIAYPFASGPSRPRNWTGISCIAGSFVTSWATRETLCPQQLFNPTQLILYHWKLRPTQNVFSIHTRSGWVRSRTLMSWF